MKPPIIQNGTIRVYPYTRYESAYNHAARLSTNPKVLQVGQYYLALGEVVIRSDGTLQQLAHGRYGSSATIEQLRAAGVV